MDPVECGVVDDHDAVRMESVEAAVVTTKLQGE
jgi:hypothetical protein